MKRILKWIAVICSFLLLVNAVVVSMIFIRIPDVSWNIFYTIMRNEWLQYVVVGSLIITAILLFVLIVKTVVQKEEDREFTIHKDAGDLTISDESIISSAQFALDGIREIKRYAVDVQGKPSDKKVTLKVNAEVLSNVDYETLAQEATSKVKEVVSGSLGVDINKVNVRVSQYTPEERTAQNKKKPPRVI